MGVPSAVSAEEIDEAIEVANRIPLTQEMVERKEIDHQPDGMMILEISKVMGITPQSVGQIINRALLKLKKRDKCLEVLYVGKG